MSGPTSMVIFQKSLQDLVKGIRSQKKDVSPYISKVIAEIKTELRSMDQFTKAEAVRKLTYLQMIGYDISFASFAIVEVMSSSRFAHKRIGYLAASQSFNQDTDVILLTTNLFKKEFAVMNSSLHAQYEIGLAISCLANVVTKDLARDCIGDVVHLMTSTEPFVRKKAVLVMFKMFMKFPQGLRLTFDKMKERLEDENNSVISSAVNVICELANRNPRNYIGMAPVFFRLLTTSSNNWMLIKVVKLFGSLVSEEPRLARKLLDPLMTIITTTSAKSLQFECINTVTLALPHTKREDGSEAKNAAAAMKTCSEYIREFIKDDDQNLKYLGLVGLINLMKINPLVAIEHRDLVLHCLRDDDMTIKSRALELLAGMVTKKSLVDLVHHLLQHAERTEGAYREEIVAKVIQMCMKDKHGLVTDFAWYISVLCSLTKLCDSSSRDNKQVNIIAEELVEITLRVDSVRPYAVESMIALLLDEDILTSQQRVVLAQVLSSAAWIVGEYASVLTSIYHDSGPENEHRYYIDSTFDKQIVSRWRKQFMHQIIMRALLHPLVGGCLPSSTQAAYMVAAMKIFVEGVSSCDVSEISQLVALLRVRLDDTENRGTFAQSANLEVEEKKSFFLQLFYDLHILFPPGHVSNSESSHNLIEFSHRNEESEGLDSSQVTEEDRTGAGNALQKANVLEALFAEPFYPVHAKAQRNVPVPPELNLNCAFNAPDLDSFLSGDEDGLRNFKPALATLSFISNSLSKPFTATGYGNNYANEHYSGSGYGESSSISKVLGDVSGTDFSTSSTPLTLAPPAVTSGNTSAKNSEDNQMFYLNSGGPRQSNAPMQFSDSHRSNSIYEEGRSRDIPFNSDTVPLSELLASGHHNSPKHSSKKHSKKSKHSKQTVQMREVAPAGAGADLGSSEDEKSGKPKKSKKHSNKNKDLDSDDEVDLENIDITVPLRPDEVIPVQKHRESSSHYEEDRRIEERKREKSSKKSKKSKKDKGDRRKTDDETIMGQQASEYAAADLLGLDMPSSEPMSSSSSSARHSHSEPSKKNILEEIVEVAESPYKKGCVWIPLVAVGAAKVMYSARAGERRSNSAEVQICVLNSNPSDSPNRVTVECRLEGACVLRFGGVAPGAPMVSNWVRAPLSTSGWVNAVQCVVSASEESLFGSSETKPTTCVMAIPLTAFMLPFEISEDEFTDIILSRGRNKGCSYFGSASDKIRMVSFNDELSTKYVLKGIATAVSGHIVSRDGSKAITVSCRSGNTDIICLLVKSIKSSGGGSGFSLSIDVKYMSGDESVDVDSKAAAVLGAVCKLVIV